VGCIVSERDTRRLGKRRRATATLRDHFAVNGTFADRVISVAHIVGRPVRNATGTRIGRVSDIVVRWDAANEHPPVTGVFVKVRGALATVQVADVTLTQSEIRLRSDVRMEWQPVWGDDDVPLARDVLDRQLVDTSGVQVVRAADAYLLNGPQGWELAGIDVGLLSFGRRLVTRRRACPPPDRIIDWAQLQAFVPRFTDTTTACQSAPTTAAGTEGSGLQSGCAAAQLKELRGPEVTALLSDLSRPQQAQLVATVQPSAAAEALRQIDPDHREALLAELDEADRARLRAMLQSSAR
jgi:magnesium transporter